LLVQKIDVNANSMKPFAERFMLCKPDVSHEFFMGSITEACYLVKEFGRETLPTHGEMCYETFQNKTLESISCKKITFLPNGSFIELPWHADIDSKPKNDYKDSLILSIGSCTTLSE
jgi:hypothetical protein